MITEWPYRRGVKTNDSGEMGESEWQAVPSNVLSPPDDIPSDEHGEPP